LETKGRPAGQALHTHRDELAARQLVLSSLFFEPCERVASRDFNGLNMAIAGKGFGGSQLLIQRR
jgi:hypothetical protein